MQRVFVPTQDRNNKMLTEEQLEADAHSVAKMVYGKSLPRNFKVQKSSIEANGLYVIFEITS